MAKRRIAILGGGMSGLSAAYHLTRTPELRAENEVTLYQMGWRLGGKAASGRDDQGRNLEHGLHVWFGCYENTFQTIQEVYAARDHNVDWALKSWRDAVKPQTFTPLGTQDASGSWSYWPLTWASNEGTPGDGKMMPTLWEMIETILDWIILYLEGKEGPDANSALEAGGMRGWLDGVEAHLPSVLRLSIERWKAIAWRVENKVREEFDDFLDMIGWVHAAHKGTVGHGAAPHSPHGITSDILNIFTAVVRGVIDDLIIPDAPLMSIDDIEFSQWLLKHGADPKVVAHSSIVRVVYDTLFQYREGDASRPDLAAGTGLGTVMRLVGTYQGTMMWEVQAGMGEVIVGPMYQHLIKAGVTFEFFHKVTQITADDGTAPKVAAVTFDVQATTSSGEYAPVTLENGLVVWPQQPDWSQIANGSAMAAAGVNFESHWYDWPSAGTKTIAAGTDFDVAVLAVSVCAFTPLNEVDGSFAAPLIAKSKKFADWVGNTYLVPSVGVQLWSNKTTAGLGWTGEKPATVSGPEYLNIWADMTQVIAYETQTPKPLSLHYLTGTFNSQLYRQPANATGTPATAQAEVTALTADWLNTKSAASWPLAQTGDGFDWSVLSAPASVTGPARLDAQYVRANVDPTECCALSATGTTKYRPHADGSGFPNLIVCGEGTVMGFTTSFEGAMASGAAASRAICGHPVHIPGYDFLERKPSQGPGR